MTPEQSQLVDRIHRALAGEAGVRVVAMFGGRAFMVDHRLLVIAEASGDLLVRVPPERFDELVARPGMSPATMGRGRRMSQGWSGRSRPGAPVPH